jgi:hypothetical protein
VVRESVSVILILSLLAAAGCSVRSAGPPGEVLRSSDIIKTELAVYATRTPSVFNPYMTVRAVSVHTTDNHYRIGMGYVQDLTWPGRLLGWGLGGGIIWSGLDYYKTGWVTLGRYLIGIGGLWPLVMEGIFPRHVTFVREADTWVEVESHLSDEILLLRIDPMGYEHRIMTSAFGFADIDIWDYISSDMEGGHKGSIDITVSLERDSSASLRLTIPYTRLKEIEEGRVWNAARRLHNARVYRAYISQYPTGRFRKTAEAFARQLGSS